MTDPDLVTIKRALISVADKSGLTELGQTLAAAGVEIVSTGGSARHLREAGIAVTDVATVTGFPEMMGGRVKTLHPLIHGGLLARRDSAADAAALAEHNIAPIDLVVVNLYPFEATVAGGAAPAECIENIDIGGVALIRAAAKNHAAVTVAVEPADYVTIQAEMAAQDGATMPALRRRLAAKAFAATASYDGAIARWLVEQTGAAFATRTVLVGVLQNELRYGENPHQPAALYRGALTTADGQRPGVAGARQIQGKALSYNNLADADAAFELVAEFTAPAAVIVKHGNPCGAAIGADLTDAHAKALAGDPTSAFGGVVAANMPLDRSAAEAIIGTFTEVIIAPGADAAARKLLATKPNLRLLLTSAMPDVTVPGLVVRPLAGGFLIQGRDTHQTSGRDLRIVTQAQPTKAQTNDMLFAMAVCKHVKSNAIVFARDRASVGIGAGQMSRIDAVRLAAWKAEQTRAAGGGRGTVGSVVASDAFFPFADGLTTAVEAGATAVVQPGGSVRDEEVIAAADAAGIAMAFTGVRHFRH